ncbi:protein of unknown function [Prevotella sp. tc2-28]|uniref:DUF4417 domain-containing protein n=1 Tax=Prevotella sp. tc2-28 TaxID=1761888 RepID=UPI00089B2C59|nr:DUF4417 domain-containing protein [Prevotella sp. tc2-28]SEA81241.1 protein of unknown function [Prevotella sp. tc2-28]
MEKYKELEQVIPDTLFPSDNDAEIPNLRLDMQAEELSIPFLCWGEQKRTTNLLGLGSMHFYTDDYRYTALYDHPEQILRANPRNIVEPNYSLFDDMPISFGLQRIYKKRWIARAMQERGIRIFVDLNVAQKFYKLNMLGVPMGWKSFCTRGYSERLENLEYEYEIAKNWAKGEEPLFVIYGGGASCRRFAQEHGCIYVNPVVTTKKKLEALKKIHEGIAFFNDEFSIKDLEKMTHFDKQLEDFTKNKAIESK